VAHYEDLQWHGNNASKPKKLLKGRMKGIQLNKRKYINTVLYADDQILMATSEDDLQKIVYHLNLIARKYSMIISSTKTKSMAMCGKKIQRVKIVINDKIIEQVTEFKYI
jgi:transposase